jgi:hypothetical protein
VPDKFITIGGVIRAVVTSVVAAVLLVGAAYLVLSYVVPEQTPNGLGG